MSENNITIVNTVSTPQPSRGSGTVLMFVFFWWLLLMWWQLLAAAWLVWLLIAGVVTIFKHDFFTGPLVPAMADLAVRYQVTAIPAGWDCPRGGAGMTGRPLESTGIIPDVRTFTVRYGNVRYDARNRAGTRAKGTEMTDGNKGAVPPVEEDAKLLKRRRYLLDLVNRYVAAAARYAADGNWSDEHRRGSRLGQYDLPTALARISKARRKAYAKMEAEGKLDE